MKGVRPLLNEEIKQVSQCFEGKYAVRNRSLFLLGVSVGGRISEMLSLVIGDVWQSDKPVSDLLFRRETVKGKKHARAVPVNTDGRKAITELVNWYQTKMTLTPQIPLFLSREGKSTPLTRRSADRILNAAFKKAGINGKLGTHTLRKSYAQRLYEASNDVYIVKEMLGHQSISTTQKYLGVNYVSVREASEMMALGIKTSKLIKPLHRLADEQLFMELARRGYNTAKILSDKQKEIP